ncbi:MAG: intermembrane phospholipid transport protein YdbH family protein [Pseudomonadota bacterium]
MPWRRWTRLAVLAVVVLIPQPALATAWLFMLQQGQIDLALPDTELGGWALTGVRADVVTAVEADNRAAVVHFRRGSRLQAAQVVQKTPKSSFTLDNVQVSLKDVRLTVDLGGSGALPQRSSVSGKVSIDVGALTHPLLKRQGWRFEGAVNGPLTDLEVEGEVRSAAGLVADLKIRNVPGEFLAARVAAELDGEQSGKTLAGTLADWPERLALDSGQLGAEATLRLQSDSPLAIEGRLKFDDVSGVMDRTALTAVNGRLLISLEREALTARFRDMSIGQINSGVAVGPVRLIADYTAPQTDVFAGILNLQQATAAFLNGRLRVAPGTIDLSGRPWRLPIDMYDVSVERLLQVYPTEGLEGTGELSGHIPVIVSEDGFEVEQGRVSASAPGGVLKLPAERLQAMLGSGQAMELVVEALQNFHYSVLDSTLDYDNKGKLVLDLRLEGENPEVRGGQPVVLNINLEEDIPALLTSLQLSGRVNEAVTERVRERLQQPGQEAVP